MEKKGKAALIITAIAALAGGGFAFSFDFSSTTTTTISGDTSGDTNINIERGEDYCKLARLACEENIIPEEYKEICPIINLVCG